MPFDLPKLKEKDIKYLFINSENNYCNILFDFIFREVKCIGINERMGENVYQRNWKNWEILYWKIKWK